MNAKPNDKQKCSTPCIRFTVYVQYPNFSACRNASRYVNLHAYATLSSKVVSSTDTMCIGNDMCFDSVVKCC